MYCCMEANFCCLLHRIFNFVKTNFSMYLGNGPFHLMPSSQDMICIMKDLRAYITLFSSILIQIIIAEKVIKKS